MNRAHKIAFLSLVSLGALLAVAQFILIGLNWSSAPAEAYYWRPAALAQAVIAVVYMRVGSYLAWRRPDNVVGWLVILIGLGGAVTRRCASTPSTPSSFSPASGPGDRKRGC